MPKNLHEIHKKKKLSRYLNYADIFVKITGHIFKNKGLFIKFIKSMRRSGFKQTLDKIKSGLYKERIIIYPANIDFTLKIVDYGNSRHKEIIEFQKFTSPRVSIIIPVYNNFKITYNCLMSIKQNTDGAEYEVILADDNSSDETAAADRYIKNIVILRDGVNRGFLKNCNNAAKYAKGEYIVFLNNDTQVQPDWLSSMVFTMENEPSAGIVGSKLVYPDGILQEAGGIIWREGLGLNYGKLDDPLKPEYNYLKEADYISGACIIIRKRLWDVIGGFDERYSPAYYENADLAFEVRKHGYKVLYQPKSAVVHFEGISHGTDETGGVKIYQEINRRKFAEKWRNTLEGCLQNGQDLFLARDRSRNKKHILVIDHHVPHYDKDAGSRTIWQYLELFIDLGYRVSFIGNDPRPYEPYTGMLQQKGIEVLYGKIDIVRWIIQYAKYFDIVFLSRPNIAEKYIDIIKKNTSSKIIYYGHDLHQDRLKKEHAVTNDKKTLAKMNAAKKQESYIFDKADIVFMPNRQEVDFVNDTTNTRKAKHIKGFFYRTIPLGTVTPFKKRSESVLFVGGFNHTPNIDGVLWFVSSVWPEIKRRNKNARFVVAGSNPPDEIKDLRSEDITVTGYLTDEKLSKLYESVKLAVIPIRYGAGLKGKTVEAIAYGLPAVCTSEGAYGLNETHDFLSVTDDPASIADTIIMLLKDEAEWQARSDKSIRYAQANFSFESVKNDFKHLI